MSSRTTPASVAARRSRVAALIVERDITSQEDLCRILAAEGISVTQATLSRDLDALGAVKQSGATGNRYFVPEQVQRDTSLPSNDHTLSRVLNETLLKAEAAQNIAVLHTPPGAAQYLAGHVDRNADSPVVGTVAGDDTIIIVMRTAEDAQHLCDTLLTLSEKG